MEEVLFMSYEAFATSVETEIQDLDYEQQLNILTIVIAAMNKAKQNFPTMPKEETMRLFDEFTGSLKVPADFNPKQEYLDYLDERYGV